MEISVPYVKLELHNGKLMVSLLKELQETILILPVKKETRNHLITRIDDIKNILKKAELDV